MEYQNFIKSSDVDIEKATNVMKQYLLLKKENSCSILFFRLGDFFETYFEDAFIFSKTANVTLTKRKFSNIGEVLMAGVPHTKVEVYVQKLVEAGFKVAITEQKGEPKKGEIVKREVVRVYSKGTLIEEEFLEGGVNNFMASVLKEDDRYGLSYSDVSTGEFFVTSGNFEEIKCELSKINPVELLLKAKPRETGPYEVISEAEPDIEEEIYENFSFTLLGEESFSEEIAFEGVMGLELKCVNSIINYTKNAQKKLMTKLNKIKKYSIQSKLIMNAKTRENIELNRNLHDKKRYASIVSSVDFTKTLMGKRLLRAWVCAPLLDEAKINERLDGVEELVLAPDKLNGLKEILDGISDTFRLSSKLSNGTILPKEFINVKNALRVTEKFNLICSGFNSPILKRNFESETLLDFAEIIERTVSEDFCCNLKTGGIIKQGANGLLDSLRGEINGLENEVSIYENELKNLCGAKNLKISVSKNVCYSIEVPISALKTFKDKLPDAFCVQKRANFERYTTERLKTIEEKISALKLKSFEIEHDMFLKLREYAKEMTEALREFSLDVATVDVICSFASCALKFNGVRPKFNSGGTFKVEEGLNPVLMALGGKVNPADIFYDENEKTKILTGANMSGKSTYLREQAALVILAQAGAFVPCKSYEAPLIDRIFVRMGSPDDTVAGDSAFMCEMKEIAEILKNSTSKSLILLDETGKSTSFKEGCAIAFGVVKYITEKIGAKTALATHFHNLCEACGKICGVKNYKFTIEETPEGIVRKLEKGSLKESYGLETAKVAGVPEDVLKYAESFILS